MKTSTRIVLPFFHALMEAYAYNSENDSAVSYTHLTLPTT